MEHEPTYTGPTGNQVEVPCDWCGGQATALLLIVPGRHAGYCSDCGDRAHRFRASLDPKLSQGSILLNTPWVPSEEHPDLVIRRLGKAPITIRDHRQMKATALKTLLPPVKIPKGRKVSKPLSAADRARSIARRRRGLDREVRELLDNPEGLTVAQISDALQMPQEELERIAA